MSAREWKPGDVAMIEVGCRANRHVGTFDGGGWRYADGSIRWAANDPAIVTARPLVVIDPDDREQVERLADIYQYGGDRARFVERLQAALREFADPKPPCDAHVNLAGADFRCVEPVEHGGPHRNPDVEAVWGEAR